MRYARYLRLEKYIAASDRGGIIERWRYGRRLLEDGEATTAAGNLKHGVLAKLIAKSPDPEHPLTEQEIQRRLRCARTYSTEDEIRESAHGFQNWDDLARAGFPPVDTPPDTLPFDPRDADEKRRDAARDLARRSREGDGQLALFEYFPDDRFDETATLAELAKYADEMAALTERYARKDRERAEYLGSLIAAVRGDLSKTWSEAQAALDRAT